MSTAKRVAFQCPTLDKVTTNPKLHADPFLTIVGEPMCLSDAVIGLKAYKEVDPRMAQLWQDVHQAIVGPRMDITNGSPPAIRVQGVSHREDFEATVAVLPGPNSDI